MDVINPAIGALQISEVDVVSDASDVFTMPGVEMTMMDNNQTAYRPTSLTDDGPYVFTIEPQGNKVVELNSIRLRIKAKVVKNNGTDFTIADTAEGVVDTAPALVNNFIGSFVKTTDISLDGVQISDLSNPHMNLKQYLETIVSYGRDARDGHLRAQGFFMDEGDFSKNSNCAKRQKFIKNSAIFSFEGPINSDFFQNEKNFIPGVSIGLTITRSPDSFLIHAKDETESYKLKILDMQLYVKHVTLTDEATMMYLKHLATKTAIIPMTKNVLKTFGFGTGMSTLSIPNMIRGRIPHQLFIFMTTSDDQNKYKENPFNFRHFNLNHAVIHVNGVQIPGSAYEPSWTNNGQVHLYRSFFDNVGIKMGDYGCCIDDENFPAGCTILAFDLSPDGCNGAHKHMAKQGSIDLEFKLGTPTPAAVVLHVLSSYDAILQISPSKECTMVM